MLVTTGAAIRVRCRKANCDVLLPNIRTICPCPPTLAQRGSNAHQFSDCFRQAPDIIFRANSGEMTLLAYRIGSLPTVQKTFA